MGIRFILLGCTNVVRLREDEKQPAVTISVFGYRALKSLSFRERSWTLPRDPDRQRPVAVEFQFVEPVWPFRKTVGAQKQHGLDEVRFGIQTRLRGLHDGKS